MKRTELIKKITGPGAVLERHGAKHNWYIKKETIILRRNTKLKLPDCIIAATTIALNAVLLTADTELLRLNYSGYTAKALIKA